jgi:hypothetical protein
MKICGAEPVAIYWRGYPVLSKRRFRPQSAIANPAFQIFVIWQILSPGPTRTPFGKPGISIPTARFGVRNRSSRSGERCREAAIGYGFEVRSGLPVSRSTGTETCSWITSQLPLIFL